METAWGHWTAVFELDDTVLMIIIIITNNNNNDDVLMMFVDTVLQYFCQEHPPRVHTPDFVIVKTLQKGSNFE
jgi:hypothetical protein